VINLILSVVALCYSNKLSWNNNKNLVEPLDDADSSSEEDNSQVSIPAVPNEQDMVLISIDISMEIVNPN
jgi:hypothetical protein